MTVAISPHAESECDRSASDDRLGAEKAVIHYHLESLPRYAARAEGADRGKGPRTGVVRRADRKQVSGVDESK